MKMQPHFSGKEKIEGVCVYVQPHFSGKEKIEGVCILCAASFPRFREGI